MQKWCFCGCFLTGSGSLRGGSDDRAFDSRCLANRRIDAGNDPQCCFTACSSCASGTTYVCSRCWGAIKLKGLQKLPQRPLTSLEAGRVPALLELFERNWVKLVDNDSLATATLQWIQPPQRTERMPSCVFEWVGGCPLCYEHQLPPTPTMELTKAFNTATPLPLVPVDCTTWFVRIVRTGAFAMRAATVRVLTDEFALMANEDQWACQGRQPTAAQGSFDHIKDEFLLLPLTTECWRLYRGRKEPEPVALSWLHMRFGLRDAWSLEGFSQDSRLTPHYSSRSRYQSRPLP